MDSSSYAVYPFFDDEVLGETKFREKMFLVKNFFFPRGTQFHNLGACFVRWVSWVYSFIS